MSVTSDGVKHGLGRDLPRLTSLRAFAALGVFAFHFGNYSQWGPALKVGGQGYTGVAFFFVLSGFVLTWATEPGRSAGSFYLRRFARVWPAHAVTASVALIVFGSDIWTALANLTLLQAWNPSRDVVFSLNGPSWSLSCEAFFYAACPLLLALSQRWPPKRFYLAAGSWAVLCAGATFVASQQSFEDQSAAFTSPIVRSGEFILGMALAVYVRGGGRCRLPVWAAAAVVLLDVQACRTFLPDYPTSDVWLTPAFALLILAAATADRAGRLGILTRIPVVYAGKVSFAFYLVHELVLRALVSQRLPPAMFLVAALSLACSGAVVLHRVVERPAFAAIVRRIRPRAVATPQTELLPRD